MTADNMLYRRAILSSMTIAQIEQHVSQFPFATVATELVANNPAFYPDETESDLTRTVALLRKLVRDAVLAGIAPARGEAGTCDLEQARIIAGQLRQARQPVKGQGILATEAAEKYGFDRGNIYNWYDKGWVCIISAYKNLGEYPRAIDFYEQRLVIARAIGAAKGPTWAILASPNTTWATPTARLTCMSSR